MEKIYKTVKNFEGIETTEEHNGYIHIVGRALTIVILGWFYVWNVQC